MNDIILTFTENLWLLTMCVAIVSLCVGSFLNVVIYRTAKIMFMEDRAYCLDRLNIELAGPPHPPFTLSIPASSCPHCHHQIRWYENIPLLSWLALRGKCSSCKAPISARYPLVELGTMLASLVVLFTFGPTLQMICGLIFTWLLIALSGIDFDTQYLPDSLTTPLLGIGLLINTQHIFTTPEKAMIGCVIGYFILWLINFVFTRIKKRVGMGTGDFKLVAGFGAWLGYEHFLPIMLISSVVGSIIGGILYLIYRESRYFPFGPCLALAAWIQLIWGKQVINWYLGVAGLN